MNYVELHLHDHYSVLDGLNTPKEYMVRAKELGMTHLAQTNHGTQAGWREFQREAKAAGIKPILGVEAYISETDRFDRRVATKRDDGTQTYNHIGLLAANEIGMNNINAMMNEAWTTGFYFKPRIDRELLEEYSEGIIVTSGCLNGLLSKPLEGGDYDKALQRAQWFKQVFDDRFFIEIQGHNPIEINKGLLRISEDTGALAVVTSDCHYARKEDLWIEEAMLILSTNPKAAKDIDQSKAQKMEAIERFNYLYPDRKMTFQEYEIYLRSADDQHALLTAQGIGDEPIWNTGLVADMIEDYPYYEGLDLLPDLSDGKPKERLRTLVMQGWQERIADGDCDGGQEEADRIEEELGIIGDLGFDKYFINLEDIVSWARAQGIFIGPGRGSAVASFICYCMHITNGIHPIRKKLLFMRFLDPDRPDWPDVDVDFESTRRHEVKEYALRKFKHVANILTIGRFKDKSSIKSAARVYKIPIGEVNKATAGIETIDDYATSEATAEFRKKWPEVLPLARALEGRIQSMGMHAGGTIIANQPIANYVPMQTANDPQNPSADRVSVIGVDMKDAESIGLIKMDFLGLNTLTVVLDALKMVRENTGKAIDPYKIPLDDSKVFEMLSRGFTKGVFQCEGGPYTKLLITMGGVANMDELVASNALVRPGAAKSSIGANFIKGKETGEFEYVHSDARWFTEETYGQMLFQEQQMLLCTQVAGMSMRDANKLRRAVSKKVLADLMVWQPAFIEGASKKIGERKAAAVWNDLEKSAEYAFNKAHSEGYSLLSYWTAWLKVNYPLEYMTSLLKHEADKDKTLDYLMECKRLGIKVLLPHVNKSGIDNVIEGDGIRLGLSQVKYISEKVGSKIIESRPYIDYQDLRSKASTKGSGINARAIDALNKVGGAVFPDNLRRGDERDYFFEYLNIPAFDSAAIDPFIKAQFRPLDEFTEDESFVCMGMVRSIKVGTGWALIDMVDETGAAGAFTNQNTPIEKGKMYVFLISNNRVARYITTDELVAGEGGTFARWLEKKSLELEEDQLRCISWKVRTTKKGTKMADAIFSDADKNLLSVMVFDRMIDKATIPCVTGAKVRPVLAETKSGAVYLQDIK